MFQTSFLVHEQSFQNSSSFRPFRSDPLLLNSEQCPLILRFTPSLFSSLLWFSDDAKSSSYFWWNFLFLGFVDDGNADELHSMLNTASGAELFSKLSAGDSLCDSSWCSTASLWWWWCWRFLVFQIRMNRVMVSWFASFSERTLLPRSLIVLLGCWLLEFWYIMDFLTVSSYYHCQLVASRLAGSLCAFLVLAQ